MKKIGIIFAMDEELNELRKYVKIKNEIYYYNLKFYEGEYNNLLCYFVESGVGKVNAARATQIMIDRFNVDCIFNIGVAGSISNDINVCDIVIGEKLVQHDFDITAFDHNLGYVPGVGVYIDSSSKLIELTKTILSDFNGNNIHYGVIASGDVFCTDKNHANNIRKEFNALCTEMEGAAVAHVCKLSNIPFLVIRSISDSVGNDNKMTYEEFLLESSKIISEFMKGILERIS